MTTSQQDYNFWVKAAAISSTLTAIFLLLIKLYAWLQSDASVMLASATDSMLDLLASATNLFILRIALSPADKEHRFGHGKAESLGSLFQASFICGSAILLILGGIDRTLNPVENFNNDIALIVTVITLVATLLLVAFQYFVVTRTKSLVIKADMLHYKSDMLLNVSVLIALFITQYSWPSADGVFTIAIGLYLLLSAREILKESLDQLMDKELEQEELVKIKEIINAETRAQGAHEIRTRKAGPITFIQFHLVLPDELSLVEAHQIGDQLEEKITAEFSPCEVLIHHDPVSVLKQSHE